jgi:hypothetical protein
MPGTTRDPNFAYLLAGLLLLLLAGPIGDEFLDSSGGLLVQIAFSLTLIVSVWSLLDSRQWFWAGIALAATSVASNAGAFWFGGVYLELVAVVTLLAFCGLTLVFTLRHVVTAGRIDVNLLTGAICIYLLAGAALAMLNLLVSVLLPGSFRGLDAIDASEAGVTLIYYTFVTLTTLGYGDVVPLRPLARTLAYLAAIAGQFYIAILVGLLIGKYLRERRADR